MNHTHDLQKLAQEIKPGQRELPAAIEALAKSTDGVAVLCSSLEERLGPVLQSEPPQPADGSKLASTDSNGPNTGYAYGVYSQAQKLQRLTVRLQSILQRLEV
jgi:hypothetical protein